MKKMAKILVIDDDERICNSLEDILKENDYEVKFAGDGSEGIEQFRIEKPDIIITDICMPDMDGIEFIRILRKLKERVPIIVMSGNIIGKNFLQAARLLGAVDTIAKPFTAKELLEKIAGILSI
ncbi:MAG: response regulator [Spirochaetota bacterium]